MPHGEDNELVSLLKGQGAIMQEVFSILEAEEKKDDLIRAAIGSSLKPADNRMAGLDPSRIFNEADIRKICVKYRLRFLPAGRFKGVLPLEAVYQVRQLEERSGSPLRGYMMLAPASRFKLCDRDADPMLFLPLGGGSHYLVHRWGKDMGPWRVLTGWPVRGPMQLAITVLLVSAILAALIPTGWLTAEPGAGWWGGYRFGAFFCTLMFACAATAFSWFTFFGQFSSEAWNSKTFN
jgi:hypothetical protein